MAILLVGVHGAPEGEHGPVARDLLRRRGATLGEGPLVELDAALAHLIPEHAWSGVRLMCDGERAHGWDTGEAVSTEASTGSRRAVQTDAAPAPIGPYSQALVMNGVLYCSGQVPLDPGTGELVEGDIAEQARACLQNLDA